MVQEYKKGRNRHAVGIWAQWPDDARWTNEGITRLLGFLIEGIAGSDKFLFRLVVPDSIRDMAERDLLEAGAELGSYLTLHSPRDHSCDCESAADLARFANAHVPVEAWLALYPNFAFAAALDAPVTVIFPDAIPKIFPEFSDATWGQEGAHLRWENDVKALLSRARRVITFSDHVASRHVHELFGYPRTNITPISHAAPDLKPWLRLMDDRRRTAESLGDAASHLREECAARGAAYLADFPFEQISFLAVSTQDRVTKNIQVAARALRSVVRDHRRPMKMFTTAPLHFEQNWTPFSSIIEEDLTGSDIISLPDLPRAQHAALLHCAEVVVHPSIFEGGHAPFPFYEAISVGTPCIMAWGPHIKELAAFEPKIGDYCFDPNDDQMLAELICGIAGRRQEVLSEQWEIYSRLLQNDWAAVAHAYAETAVTASEL